VIAMRTRRSMKNQGPRRGLVVWNRVEPVAAKRVAAAKPFRAQPAASQHAEPSNGFG